MKSAYKLELERICIEGRSLGGSSGGGTSDLRVWKHLWKMRVPGKVKVFAWKACHNILATQDNLVKRGICQDNVCPCCKTHFESSFVLFGTVHFQNQCGEPQ